VAQQGLLGDGAGVVALEPSSDCRVFKVVAVHGQRCIHHTLGTSRRERARLEASEQPSSNWMDVCRRRRRVRSSSLPGSLMRSPVIPHRNTSGISSCWVLVAIAAHMREGSSRSAGSLARTRARTHTHACSPRSLAVQTRARASQCQSSLSLTHSLARSRSCSVSRGVDWWLAIKRPQWERARPSSLVSSAGGGWPRGGLLE